MVVNHMLQLLTVIAMEPPVVFEAEPVRDGKLKVLEDVWDVSLAGEIVVFKNNELGMIKWEQLVFLGNPQHGVELEPIDRV
jgi:glucose-6-phosphate 1-dehydrogenase